MMKLYDKEGNYIPYELYGVIIGQFLAMIGLGWMLHRCMFP